MSDHEGKQKQNLEGSFAFRSEDH